MYTYDQSRKSLLTLEDVLAVIAAAPGLAPRLRQDLISALRSFCRIIGRSPADVPADVETVRKLSSAPRPPDVRPERWRNIRSLVGKALQMTGIVRAPRRSSERMSPDWHNLVALLCDRYDRSKLSRLARYCSTNSILPSQLDDAVISGFAAFLSETLVDRPKAVCRDAVITWNKAAAGQAGWPATTLSVPSNRRDYSLALQAFNADFVADAEAFIKRLETSDPFSEDGRRAASPVTVRTRRLQLRQMATALVLSGWPKESITGLASLVEAKAAKAILMFHWERSGERKTGQIHNQALLLIQIGKYWAKLPPDEIKGLSQLRRRMAPEEKGMTERNRARLRAFDDERNVVRLLRAPAEMMRRLPTKDVGYNDAIMAQSALGLALLLVAPIRMKNLASLSRRHFVRTSFGKDALVHLVILAEEVKNGQALEFELPPNTAQLLGRYLELYLPALTRTTEGVLFPGRDGQAKTPAHLSVQLQRHLKAATGLNMNMHLFRHFAAKLVLKAYPGEHETVRQLLGHKRIETTIRAYCDLKQSDAVRRYDNMLRQYDRVEVHP
jgi:integrase